MKALLVVCAACIATLAPCQPAKADQAKFVAERANNVSWNPDGSFLGYTFKEKSGHISEIGLYDLVHHRGKTLLAPPAGEDFDEPTWLAGGAFQLVVSTQKSTESGKNLLTKTIWALDGGKFIAKKLWSEVFPEAQNPNITIEVSPSLTHAIVGVFASSSRAYYVVTLGAQDAVISPDISAAIQQGQGFAGWTMDGTAFFGGGSTNDLSTTVFELKFGLDNLVSSASKGGDGATVLLDLTGAVEAKANRELRVIDLISGLLNRSSHNVDVPVGAEGLELMPSNGILRPVRFKGFWQDEERPDSKTVLTPNDQVLKYKQSTSGIRALWLTSNEKDPQVGVLVSPQAEKSWLHPDGHTVAFTVNGALFVKSIKVSER